MNKLKPCPFCGGEAHISTDPDGLKDTWGRFWAFTVVCDRCAATSGLGFNVDMIANAWNRRAKDEAHNHRL